jgi:hypothetical protein
MTVCPGARCRFFDPASPDELWQDWEATDFVFVPETSLSMLRPPRVDLTVDVMTLRHVSAERLSLHVQRAFDFGSRYFYSVFPGGAEDDRRRVRQSLERLYWPHPIPARGEPGQPPAYAHLIGWRRLLV